VNTREILNKSWLKGDEETAGEFLISSDKKTKCINTLPITNVGLDLFLYLEFLTVNLLRQFMMVR
jgi:hypothetical protein